MASPTALTLRALRSAGYTAEPVERYVAAVNVRKDWGGFGDVLAAGRGEIVLVQVTTANHVSHRLTKATLLPNCSICSFIPASSPFASEATPITVAVPITTPSTVRNERNLCDHNVVID